MTQSSSKRGKEKKKRKEKKEITHYTTQACHQEEGKKGNRIGQKSTILQIQWNRKGEKEKKKTRKREGMATLPWFIPSFSYDESERGKGGKKRGRRKKGTRRIYLPVTVGHG